MSRLTRFPFTVTGRGRFPMDMLRYDHCFPDSSEDAAKITRCLEAPDAEEVSIKLISYFGHPNKPTVQRWRSFSWNVTNTGRHEIMP